MTRVEIIWDLVLKFENGDIAGICEHLGDDFIYSDTLLQQLDKRGLCELLAAIMRAFPGMATNLKIIAENPEGILTLISPVATHTGILTYPGITAIEPTGTTVALPPCPLFFIFSEEKVAKMRLEDVSGGGMIGILKALGIELPPDLRVEE